MIRCLLILFFVSTISTLKAQISPAIQWQNAIGGKYAGYVNKMAPTNDGGYIAVGVVDSINGIYMPNFHGYVDVWVAKLDKYCNIEWQKCFGSSGADYANIVLQTKDGGYIIVGEPGVNDGDVSGCHGGGDIWVLKLTYNGILQWQKCLGGSDSDGPSSIKETIDGGYIVVGETQSSDGDVNGLHYIWPYLNPDGWVVKLDSIGTIEWQKCLGGYDSDRMLDIQQNIDGSYIVVGEVASYDGDVTGNHGRADAWVVKLTNNGAIIWQKCYGGSDIDYANIIKKKDDGGYILAGGTLSNDIEVSGNHGHEDMWVVKIDSIGNIEWQKCYGGSDLENLFGFETTNDNGAVFCGVTHSKDGNITGFHGYEDFWLVKIDSIGKIQWQRCLGGEYGGQAYDVYETKDGGFLVGGISGAQVGNGDVTVHINMDSNSITANWWVVKLAFENNALQINTHNNQLQVYPNPAHDFVGIQTDNIKEIRILDVAGRQYLHRTINTAENIYTYFNIQYLARGVYIIQTIGNDGSIKVGELMVE